MKQQRLSIYPLAFAMPAPVLEIKGSITQNERNFIKDIFDTLPFISTDSAKPFIKSKVDTMSRAFKCPTLSILLGHNKALFYKNQDGRIASQTPVATIALQ